MTWYACYTKKKLKKGKTLPEKSIHQPFYISVFTNVHERATCSYVHFSSQKFYTEVKDNLHDIEKAYKKTIRPMTS